MEKLVAIHQWLSLGNEERLYLREVFKIPRSSGTIMLDGKLQSDGHTLNDLRAINVESMQKYLGTSETNFDKLLDLVVEKTIVEVTKQREAVLKKMESEHQEEARQRAYVISASILDTIKKLPVEAQTYLHQELEVLLGLAKPIKVEESTVETEKKNVKTKQKGKATD